MSNWKFVFIFLFMNVGHLAQAACPNGWKYFPQQKACQYFHPNVTSLNCATVANSSFNATQTCISVGNCRAHFIPKCENMQSGCKQDIAKKCNNNEKCIKATKCPGQFVMEGINMSVVEDKKLPQDKTGNSGGGNGKSTGTGTSPGKVVYSGGLGTGEGY